MSVSKSNKGILLGLSFIASVVCTGSSGFAANGSVVFTYDSLGRIATMSYDTGVFVIYSYDANGNRLSQTTNVNSTTLVWGSGNWGQTLW